VRFVGRVLITVVVAFSVVFVCLDWIAPVVLSFYAAEKAPPIARIVPIELKDKVVSKAAGTSISYFGYEFEVPWSDLDETQTKVYPRDKPEKTKVDLRFRSGLRVVFSAHHPKERVNALPAELGVSRQELESVLGRETMTSDYGLTTALYEFTPDNMNYWTVSQGACHHEELLLTAKSIALAKSAETGIFSLRSQGYKGFQEGNPRVRQDGIVVELYSDNGGVVMSFFQSDYHNFSGVTQPEINRMVQSLRKATGKESTTPPMAQE
jgi:hypothetical protein